MNKFLLLEPITIIALFFLLKYKLWTMSFKEAGLAAVFWLIYYGLQMKETWKQEFTKIQKQLRYKR